MKAGWLYAATIGFALGIFLATLSSVSPEVIVWVLVVTLGLAVLWRRHCFAMSAPYLLGLTIFLLGVSLGMLRLDPLLNSAPDVQLQQRVGEEVELTGVVTRDPEHRETSTHLYVDLGEETILAYAPRTIDVSYGDRVEVEGELERPEAFETDLGRTFDYRGYLKAQGVHFVVFRPEVTVLEEGAGNIVLHYLFRFKESFLAEVGQLIPEPQAGLGAGLLLGVKGALGESLEQVFRQTGIIHIVVLSGYNVMIVAEAIMRSLAYFFTPRVRLIFGVTAITGFAVLVGLGPTVVRASIMAVLVLLARATGRIYLVLRALMFAGVVMLLINPHLLLYDPGFQLSFLASLGLILVAPHIERWLGFAPTMLQMREFLTATIATQLFVLPLLLYSIGEFSVVAVAVNVLVLPAVPLAMGLVFGSGMLGFLSPGLALPMAWVANIVLAYIILTAEWFAALPFASFVVPEFPFWVVVVSYGLMGLGLWYLEKRQQAGILAGWTIEDEAAAVRSTAAAGRSVW